MFKMKKSVAAVAAILAGMPLMASAVTGPSTTTAPYLLPLATAPGWAVTSILTTGNVVGGYTMGGLPDGLGAFDNNDGTFTVLMNHEWNNTVGSAHTHNPDATKGGAYVSKWVIDKSTLAVQSGGDLITKVYGWDNGLQKSQAVSNLTTTFSRFCSADLPAASALFNVATGMGTQAKLFMTGEEGSANGWAQATVVNGVDAGSSYTLGKFNLATNGSGGTAVGGWENILINPFAQDKTIAIGTNDGGTLNMANTVAVYVGTKTNTGSEVDKAGLNNGNLKFINVTGNALEIANGTTRATNIVDGTAFTLSDTATTFSRPEDGTWSADGSKFWFVTTDQLDKTEITGQTQVGRSRLWELDFADITNPELGGTIKKLLDGTEGQIMMDNMTVSADGKSLILQEDTGNAPHNAKVWSYDLATDSLTAILKHDASLFGDVVGGNVVVGSVTADEESSGVIDVSAILGYDAFMLVTQNHKSSSNPLLVEGGQLQLVTAPAAVPVPAAAWLFGSAIMGFLGFTRRNKKG
jgi:hypothetical protein